MGRDVLAQRVGRLDERDVVEIGERAVVGAVAREQQLPQIGGHASAIGQRLAGAAHGLGRETCAGEQHRLTAPDHGGELASQIGIHTFVRCKLQWACRRNRW